MCGGYYKGKEFQRIEAWEMKECLNTAVLWKEASRSKGSNLLEWEWLEDLRKARKC